MSQINLDPDNMIRIKTCSSPRKSSLCTSLDNFLAEVDIFQVHVYTQTMNKSHWEATIT